jgi:hypothetical protein
LYFIGKHYHHHHYHKAVPSDSHKDGNKDDFQIIQSRLRNIDSIMVGLDGDDDVEDDTNKVQISIYVYIWCIYMHE